MLIPIKWLKEYVDTNLSNEGLANILTFGGLTIEEIANEVMDAEVTSNRSDWLSIYGVARELSALSNIKLIPLEKPKLKIQNIERLKVNFEDDLVLRFSGYIIEDIKIGESPDWLKSKLQDVGIRSINNIVDITNYIMIETGQPLHAFDYDKLSGDFFIRRGKKGESITTLDQIARPIDENVIIAENNGKIIDLVGIMGGALSDTAKNTKNILLQAAVFPPALIRKSSKTIKLSTEASYRYERGVDYHLNKDYLDLAANLVLKLSGGQISQLIDILPAKLLPKEIEWTIVEAESLLGIKIVEEDAINNLARLGIQSTKKNNKYISTPPSWRFDLKLKEDIFEEIIRFFPLDKIPRTKLKTINIETKNSEYYKTETVKDQLINLGFTEIDGYSFLSGKNLIDANLDPKQCLEASNPLSEEYQYLRPSLLPDMLLAVAQNPLFNPITMFEIGNVFNTDKEQTNLGLIIASNDSENDFYDLITRRLKTHQINEKIIKINQNVLDKYKIRKKNVYFIEFPFSEMSKNISNPSFEIPIMDQKYTSISKFPAVKRDLAIIVDKDLDLATIEDTIKKSSNKDIDILTELFDEFISDRFGHNKKSVAFHILYQPTSQTLTDQEVQKLHYNIIENLKSQFQATPRI